MKDRLASWWRLRTRREQGMLAVMAALLLIVLLWLSLFRPLGDATAAARERHGLAVVALGKARAQAERLGELKARPAPVAAGPVDLLLSRSATEAGFQVARVDREGPMVATIAIDAARPQAFFGWVGDMEASGLLLERLNATANSDQTLSVRATFRGRSR